MRIAILGGTGNEGFGLAFRWAAAGHEITIGSRLAEKGERAAADLKRRLPGSAIFGAENLAATQWAETVVLSVPYEAQKATLDRVKEALAGKLLITVVAPTGERAARVRRLSSGVSAAEEAQSQLGETTRVVAAFQNISAHHLLNPDLAIDCDVLVCGARKADKDLVVDLAKDAGMRGINVGALENAVVAEGLVSLLIAVNVIHKIKDAGIRITGI